MLGGVHLALGTMARTRGSLSSSKAPVCLKGLKTFCACIDDLGFLINNDLEVGCLHMAK